MCAQFDNFPTQSFTYVTVTVHYRVAAVEPSLFLILMTPEDDDFDDEPPRTQRPKNLQKNDDGLAHAYRRQLAAGLGVADENGQSVSSETNCLPGTTGKAEEINALDDRPMSRGCGSLRPRLAVQVDHGLSPASRLEPAAALCLFLLQLCRRRCHYASHQTSVGIRHELSVHSLCARLDVCARYYYDNTDTCETTGSRTWYGIFRMCPDTSFILSILRSITAPLSLLADYFHMDHDSIYHVVDRFVAVPSLLLEVWKVMCLWQFGRTSTAAVYSMLTMTAVYCFAQSQHAQSIQDAQGFVTWHNRWHL